MAKGNWINLPIKEGIYSRQAHCDLPAGTYERELGREGFYGPATHMYHQHPPTGWVSFEGSLQPNAYNLHNLDVNKNNPWENLPLLSNANLAIRYWQVLQSMDFLLRNSDGDDLLFVHKGTGDFYCDYGHLTVNKGDYLLIPRGTAWRINIHEPCVFLMIENHQGAYRLPEKGMLGPHAIFDVAMLDHPRINEQFKAQQNEDHWKILVKRLNLISTVTYPYNPLDAIGWHGSNTVFRINCHDIRPIVCPRYHLPPSIHTTFVADNFVICTFCPRPVETDPKALKVPFFHNNDDYDEVIFYHEGNFFSRDHIEAGMLTFHPSGVTHGPHPKALQKSLTEPATSTNEVAVMLDARYPLQPSTLLNQVREDEYVNSWKTPQGN